MQGNISSPFFLVPARESNDALPSLMYLGSVLTVSGTLAPIYCSDSQSCAYKNPASTSIGGLYALSGDIGTVGSVIVVCAMGFLTVSEIALQK